MKCSRFHCLIEIMKRVQELANTLQFSKMLVQVNIEHIFRYLTDKVYELSLEGILDPFVKSSYRLVALKILYQQICRKEKIDQSCPECRVQREGFKCEISKLGKIIKLEYCIILQKIKDKKCETVQLFLFLLFFSTKLALSFFCKHLEIFHHLQQKLLNREEEIENLSCIYINFQITGISISTNVYINLKKKYYRQYRTSKVHRRFRSVEQLSNNQNCLYSSNISNQKHQKVPNNRSDLFKGGVKHQGQSSRIVSTTKVKLRNSSSQDYRKMLSKGSFDEKKSFASAVLKNSEAFKQNRKFIFLKNRKVEVTRRNQDIKIKNTKRGLAEKNNKKSLDLGVINSAIKMFISKSDKKYTNREVQKNSIELWYKKLGAMRAEAMIPKVTFQNNFQAWDRISNFTQHEGQQQNGNQKLYSEYNKIWTSRAPRQGSRRKEQIRKGFCEFIDQRQPKQIGIVRSIVNTVAQSQEKKEKLLNSKNFRSQYKDFLGQMDQHYYQFLDQNDYIFRLQKALTGANKF